MDPSFWHERWQSNNIGFHREAPNELLVQHWPALGLAKGSRVLVPLCGKSLDLAWLAGQGHRVVGAELSPLAVEQLFEGLKLQPQVSQRGDLRRFEAQELVVYQGDFFGLEPQELGPVDAVYDRAALVALPAPMRQRYAAHLRRLAPGAAQLVVTYQYDQAQADGPPFAVPAAELESLYGAHWRLQRLAEAPVPGGFRGKIPATESVWALRRP